MTINAKHPWSVKLVFASAVAAMLCLIGVSAFDRNGDGVKWLGISLSQNGALSILIGLGLIGFTSAILAIAAAAIAWREIRGMLRK